MTNVTDIRKNCMGTICFTAQFKGMRKPQEFIVYPQLEKDCIKIQSDTRCGIISGDTVTYGIAKVFVQLTALTPQKDTIENINELREAIRATASRHAGTNGIVYCDNSSAANV